MVARSRKTEWSKWVESEKQQLAIVMERCGFARMGTHEKHLSILEYQKKIRAAEVKELEDQLDTEYEEAGELEMRLLHLRETDAKVQELQMELDTNPNY